MKKTCLFKTSIFQQTPQKTLQKEIFKRSGDITLLDIKNATPCSKVNNRIIIILHIQYNRWKT